MPRALGWPDVKDPSPEHERFKKVSGRFIETLAEELAIPIEPLGSTTFKHPGLSGAEPDECFYICNIEAVRGKKRLDLTTDPAPDLVVEIDVTNSSRHRLQVYADLGVTEVWVYDGASLAIQQLRNGLYVTSQESQFFTNIPVPKIADFLQQAETENYLTLVKAFRDWVRSHVENNP